MDDYHAIADEIFANIIGRKILQYCKSQHILDEAAQDTESAALSILAQIRSTLDNEILDDSECFQRIEAIINALHAQGLSTSRHDWG